MQRLLCFLLLASSVHGQSLKETSPPEHIKTIVFKSAEVKDQFPLVPLGSAITLSFDDLNADETDYYYKIKHFNADWTPSNLFSNEVFDGFDNIRIENFINSFNTLQRYTHYELTLPNEDTQIKVSGNFLLEIYNTFDSLVFSRKFCVYEEKASIQGGTYHPQNTAFFATHQALEFNLAPLGTPFNNPRETIQIAIIQNYHWEAAVYNPKPRFFRGNSIEYSFNPELWFEGGNEYFFFDNKDLRISTANISHVRKSDLYETFLFTNRSRALLPYQFAQDINGDFSVRTLMGTQDPAMEADYGWVHFSLLAPFDPNSDDAVYVYGKFNNYECTEENRMYFNPESGYYEGILLLKQGFYNYKFVQVDSEGAFKVNRFSGSHFVTENDYLILAYYRNFGSRYDELIGVGRVNSFHLSN